MNGKTYTKVIGCIKKEYILEVCQWGIRVLVEVWAKDKRLSLNIRRFNFTSKEQTYNDILKRIESYYKLH